MPPGRVRTSWWYVLEKDVGVERRYSRRYACSAVRSNVVQFSYKIGTRQHCELPQEHGGSLR